LRRTEYVAPPSRVRASYSVTLAPRRRARARRDPGEAAADDGDARAVHAALRARLCASTQPFSQRRSDGRPLEHELGSTRDPLEQPRYAPAIASTHAALRRSSSGTSVEPGSSRPSARCASNATSSSAGPRCARRDVTAEAVEVLAWQVDAAVRTSSLRSRRMFVSWSATPSSSPASRAARSRRLEDAEREPADRSRDAPAVELRVGERRVLVSAHVHLRAVDEVAERVERDRIARAAAATARGRGRRLASSRSSSRGRARARRAFVRCESPSATSSMRRAQRVDREDRVAPIAGSSRIPA
jgi:hypothetical protein